MVRGRGPKREELEEHKEREMERIREKVSKMTKGHQRRTRGPRAQDKRQKGKLKTYSLR